MTKILDSLGLLAFLLIISLGVSWIYSPQNAPEWWRTKPTIDEKLLPAPTPTPTPDPSAESLLSDLQKKALATAQSQLTASSKYRLDQVLHKYPLSSAEREVVLFLHLVGWGFTDQINADTDRYYSGWYQYTIDIPHDWKVFKGDAGRMGFLAPETEWEKGDYYNYQILSDVFVHANCKFEGDFKDFQTSMIAGRLQFYDYPNLSGPRDASVSAFPAKKYQYTLYFPKPNSEGYHQMAQTTVEDFYFMANNQPYLVNLRYDRRYKPEYDANLRAILNSFQPGERECLALPNQVKSANLDEIIEKLGEVHDASEIEVRMELGK